jgi:L-ascorbate metabolism protein UlaG (beta-lactamase superfamily)
MLTQTPYTESLQQALTRPLPGTQDVALYWLGQAGFAIRYQDFLIFIDPYLSDFLAKKYTGKFFPHTRMMPPPVSPTGVRNLDLLLCTHGHSDHLDPETVPVLAQNNRECVVVVPKLAEDRWGKLEIPPQQVHGIDAGEQLSLENGISLEAIPAAHETLQTNERGEHLFLGYILKLGGLSLYHSGDCVPYPGLVENLAAHSVDLALLPVNGRDEYRQSHGVPGNFTLAEAVDLGKQAQIPYLLGHHFGMFEFNTIDAKQAGRELQHIREHRQYALVKDGVQYILSH